MTGSAAVGVRSMVVPSRSEDIAYHDEPLSLGTQIGGSDAGASVVAGNSPRDQTNDDRGRQRGTDQIRHGIALVAGSHSAAELGSFDARVQPVVDLVQRRLKFGAQFIGSAGGVVAHDDPFDSPRTIRMSSAMLSIVSVGVGGSPRFS